LQGWLLGYQMAFDSGKSKLTKNNFAVGYSTGDFVIHTNVNDGQVTERFCQHSCSWTRE
jgi:voltage-dependent anion channel protein 2